MIINSAIFFILSFAFHGDLDDRISSVSERLKLEPDNAELYLVRGHLHHQHEEYAKAITDYLEAESLNLDTNILDFRLAETYLQQEDYDKGLHRIESYLAQNQNAVLGLKLRAKLAQGNQDLTQAESDFRAVIDLTSKTIPQNYLDLATVQLAQSPLRVDDALATLREGIDVLGPIVSLQHSMLQILEKESRFEEAILLLDEMTVSLDRSERVLVKKAEILILKGEQAIAMQQLEIAEKSLLQLPKHIQNTPANKRLLSQIQELKEQL